MAPPAPAAGGQRPRVRLALVAGGGAVKAYAFHLGVLRGLSADGFSFLGGARWDPTGSPPGGRQFDTYVGSSAGSCVVAALAAGRGVEQLRQGLRGEVEGVPTFGYRTLFVPVAPNPLRYAARLRRRSRLGRLHPGNLLDLGGFFTTSGVEKFYRKHVLPSNRFADLAPELYITATQVNGSRTVVFGPRDSLQREGYDPGCAYYDNVPVSQAVAAAVAVPPVFAPFAIVNPSSGEQFHYYDGEVRETLSTQVARDTGADFIVISTIWGPHGYDEQMGTLADMGMTVLAEQALHQLVEQKVQQDRRQASRFDRVLQAIEAHGARHGMDAPATEALKEQVSGLLRHRPARVLYVTPDPEDHEFYLSGFFSFRDKLVSRCLDAGQRAYRQAACSSPEFFRELDQALRDGR